MLVNSFNEWDPLEEVIVGRIDSSTVPEWAITLESTMPSHSWQYFKENGGRSFSQDLLSKAKDELDGFATLLADFGVKVQRPDSIDQSRSFSTPDWRAAGGLYSAMPRDSLLVVGNQIIEAPMAWRNRYFETQAFRRLLKQYFLGGARWIAAPKPELTEPLFNLDYRHPKSDRDMNYAITEFEPVFDAADFARCGRDIFAQQSNVTNRFGIEWLRRHLGSDFNIHILEVRDTHPMHIDATFVPLAPGRIMVNPERIVSLPDIFKNWQILTPPPPITRLDGSFAMCSNWITSNVFMLDERRVFVEKSELPLIKAFESWGFEPIPYSLINFNRFGGGFHCCTLDIRRRGELQCYF